MKKLILSLLVVFVMVGLQAQRAANVQDVQSETEALTSLYQLDQKQTEQMRVIQERRFKNLAEIEVLKNKNELMYLSKKKSIRKGTEAAIKMLLNEAQMQIFNAQILERRKKESNLVKKMRTNGASKEEIEKVLLQMDN